MAIILPHTAADIQFFRSNGVCYRRTSWGSTGTPDHTWDEMVAPSDFGIYASCSACQNAPFVPSICPCSSWPPPSSGCGDPEDPIYPSYTVALSNVAFSGCSPMEVAIDMPIWEGVVTIYSDARSCHLNGLPTEGHQRIDGTNLGMIYNPYIPVNLDLVTREYWVLSVLSGNCRGYWLKTTGNSFAGTYTLAPYDYVPTGFLANKAIAPATVSVTPIVP